MTPTEKGRRFDALYHGEFIRQTLCEMVVNREGDLEDARSDNARLRKEVSELHDLVRHMWGWLTVRTVGGAALHDISGRMRELGIEVEE